MSEKNKLFFLSILIAFIGFTSVFSQSIFIRELIVVFSGNEGAIGIILCFWLFWSSVGSIILGKLGRRIIRIERFFFFIYLTYIIFILVELILIRNIRVILRLNPGEIVGPIEMIYISFFVLAPFSLTNGSIFILSVEILSKLLAKNSLSMVYSIDALGDMLGGLAFSFLFVFILSSFHNLYLMVMLNLFFILMYVYFYRLGKIYFFLTTALIFTFIIFGFFVHSIDSFLLNLEWKEFNLIAKKISPYSNIYITKNRDSFSVFENGFLSFSFPEPLNSQETVHLTFLQSKDCKRILIVGEGVSGLLYEILKYPVEEVYYLELDHNLISLLKNYLPPKYKGTLYNPKVKIYNLEARVFLNYYRGEKFDIVLINTPPPYNAYLNRFYTYEFFNKIKTIIKEEGVFSFTLPYQEGYLSKELRNLISSIYYTLNKVFPHILHIPGRELRFIASLSSTQLTYNPDIISARLEKYNLSTEFFNRFYLESRLLPWHINYLGDVIRENSKVRLNYDFSPVSYYYGIIFFSSFFKFWLVRIFYFLIRIKPYFYLILFFMVWIFTYALKKRYFVILSVFSMGGLGIASLIISILGFEIIYGYVYHKIGLMSTFFMLGLACGSNYFNKKRYLRFDFLPYLYFIGAIYVFFLPYLFRLLEKLPIFFSGVSFIFPFLGGILVGLNFSWINALNISKGFIKNPGTIYAFDLVGGGSWGIFLSLFLIPLYGLFISSGIISFILLLSGILNIYYFRSVNYG
ncbi:MAG: hypothetical protein NC904_01425 [Candidatus Omnitrophica bacterium]|nr:hypothetical protein [Candidatus Omnitrophota bacterium]